MNVPSHGDSHAYSERADRSRKHARKRGYHVDEASSRALICIASLGRCHYSSATHRLFGCTCSALAEPLFSRIGNSTMARVTIFRAGLARGRRADDAASSGTHPRASAQNQMIAGACR